MDGKTRTTGTRRVWNDYKLHQAGDLEGNVSAYVHGHVKLYQQPTFFVGYDEKPWSWPRIVNDLIEDEVKHFPRLFTPNVSGDHTNELRCH